MTLAVLEAGKLPSEEVEPEVKPQPEVKIFAVPCTHPHAPYHTRLTPRGVSSSVVSPFVVQFFRKLRSVLVLVSDCGINVLI